MASSADTIRDKMKLVEERRLQLQHGEELDHEGEELDHEEEEELQESEPLQEEDLEILPQDS